ALSANASVFAATAADDSDAHPAFGCLFGEGGKEIRPLGAGVGLVELGLGKSRTDPAGDWDPSNMASLRRNPPESAAVVGLLQVALSSDRGVPIFHWALGDRPAVPQVCAFAAEGPSTNSRPRADGTAHRRKHSAGADVLDGCERKNHGFERVCNR